MDWMFVLKLFVTLLVVLGAIAVVLGFPGTFLSWLGLVVFSLATRFAEISGWALLGTFVGCLLIELPTICSLEFWLSGLGQVKGAC